MFAARAGNDALVRKLVARGADLNLKNGDAASATMVAIYNDRFDVAATLIELGSDVNDGSLYVAVEMRDATTDQFAFDGSRRRPDHPQHADGARSDEDAARARRRSEPAVPGPVPLHAHAQHRPVRQHAVLPRRRRGRRRSAQGDGRARRQARSDAAGGIGTREKAWRYQRWGSPRQSQRRPHAGDGGDDRWTRSRR